MLAHEDQARLDGHAWPLWKAILVPGLFAVGILPGGAGDRLGYGEYSGFQLKIIQRSSRSWSSSDSRPVPQGETRLELSRGVCLSAFAAILAFAFKAPDRGLNEKYATATICEHHANDPINPSPTARAPRSRHLPSGYSLLQGSLT